MTIRLLPSCRKGRCVVRSVSLTFHHDSGARCVVSLGQDSGRVEARYSLRANPPLPVELATAYLNELQDWCREMLEDVDSARQIPAGWR